MGKAPSMNPVHPAKKLLGIALVLTGLSVLLGFIAVFVPWSQKDVSSTLVAYFYPFRWCLRDRTSVLHYMQCEDTDFGGYDVGNIVPFSVPTAGNLKCRGFFIATVVFVFIHVIIGVFALVFLAATIAKLWTKLAGPLVCLAATALFISFAGSLCSWIMFIIFAEETCITGTVYPIRGYSYGWIMEIFATACSLLALLLGCLAMMKVAKAGKAKPVVPPPMVPPPVHEEQYGYAPYGPATPYMSPVYMTPMAQPMAQPYYYPPVY